MAAIDAPIISAFDHLENPCESAIRLVGFTAHVLSVSASQGDHLALRRIVDDTQWSVTTADTCREAQQKLRDLGALAIFSELSFADGTWKDILELSLALDDPPVLVVTSRLADDFLWSEVLNLGGYDVLLKPFVKEEVRRVLASIWTHRASPHRPHVRVLPAAS